MTEIGKLKRGPSALSADGIAFEMRYLGKRDLPQIMALQDIILSRLSRKDLLEAFPREFMESHIGAKGVYHRYLCSKRAHRLSQRLFSGREGT